MKEDSVLAPVVAIGHQPELLASQRMEGMGDLKAIIASIATPVQLTAFANAYAERWVRSAKEECLTKLVLFGEASLRRALADFIDHYHEERNHQGKGNTLLFPSEKTGQHRPRSRVHCRDRLGGLLKYCMSFLTKRGPSISARVWVAHHGAGSVIDLRFFARRGLDHHASFRRRRSAQFPYEAFDAGVLAGESMVVWTPAGRRFRPRSRVTPRSAADRGNPRQRMQEKLPKIRQIPP
jgi:hypothetical protein